MKEIHIAEAKPDNIFPTKKPVCGSKIMRNTEANAEAVTPKKKARTKLLGNW